MGNKDVKPAQFKQLETNAAADSVSAEEHEALRKSLEEALVEYRVVYKQLRKEQDYRAQRDFLWRGLAEIEVWLSQAPGPDIALRALSLVKAVLDKFQPTFEQAPRALPEGS